MYGLIWIQPSWHPDMIPNFFEKETDLKGNYRWQNAYKISQHAKSYEQERNDFDFSDKKDQYKMISDVFKKHSKGMQRKINFSDFSSKDKFIVISALWHTMCTAFSHFWK